MAGEAQALIMTNLVSRPPADAALIGATLARISGEVGSMLGHEVLFEAARVERARARPAGSGSIHISFKLGFRSEAGTELFGCLLVPLADAITMACFLLMIPEESVASRREESALDAAFKDAMLEIGNMLGSATSSALAELGLSGWSARSEGCQGVRADVRPAFPYVEESPLVVGRVAARFGPFPTCELILILPALG